MCTLGAIPAVEVQRATDPRREERRQRFLIELRRISAAAARLGQPAASLAPASEEKVAEGYLAWGADLEEEAEAATEEDEDVDEETEEEDDIDEEAKLQTEEEAGESEASEELDFWAGCVTPTKNTSGDVSPICNAMSAVKGKRPRKRFTASCSDASDGSSFDKFDDVVIFSSDEDSDEQ